jgi:hypothetical protein
VLPPDSVVPDSPPPDWPAPASAEPASATALSPPPALSPAPALSPVPALPGATALSADVSEVGAGAGVAVGGPAGRVTARRVRRSRPLPLLSFSVAELGASAELEPPDPVAPSTGSLFCRSISSIRAISPVRLPGAVGLHGPVRAARELFVRALWSGARRAGVPRFQARCQYLSLCSVPPAWPGRLRHCVSPRGTHPGQADLRCRFRQIRLVSRLAGARSAGLRGGNINAERPLSQPRHHCR